MTSGRAEAATFIVDTWGDAGYSDGTCTTWNPGTGDDCTLRDAIDAANASPGSDIIEIGPIAQPAFSGTLFVDLAGSPEDANASGDFDIWDSTSGTSLTIRGGSLAVDANNVLERILHTLPSGGGVHAVDLFLEDAALTRGSETGAPGGCILAEEGDVTGTRIDVFECLADFSLGPAYVPSATGVRGGGAIAAYGNLTLVDSKIGRNLVSNADGGGLYVEGTLDLDGVQCDQNEVLTDGNGGCAAVYAGGSSHQFVGSEIIGNAAKRDGGGLYLRDTSGAPVSAGAVSMDGVWIVQNDSDQRGGGMWIAVRDVSIVESVLDFNTAAFRGGGAYWVPGAGSGTVPILDRSSIVNNEADNEGGGIFFHTTTSSGGTHILRNTTVGENQCSALPGNPGCGLWLGTGAFGGGSALTTVRLQHATVVDNSTMGTSTPSLPATLHVQNTGHGFELENSIVDGHCEDSVRPPGTYTSLGGNVFNSGPSPYVCPAISSDATPMPMGTSLLTTQTDTPLPHYDNGGLGASIDHTTCPAAVTQDQVGTPRPIVPGLCDAGSIEQ